MKIQIKSDLHKETRLHHLKAKNIAEGRHKSLMSPDADILVLAGDISNYVQRFSLHYELMHLQEETNGKPVIYVPGNHEYYTCDLAQGVVPELKEMYRDTNIHVMDNESIILGDTVFICSTLWSDLSDPYIAFNARHFLNDFRMPGLTVEWYNRQHKEAVNYLERTLPLFNQKKVVITHHGPSFKSAHPRYEGSLMNACFYTDLEYLMSDPDTAPHLWIHGHTHDQFDYQLGNTRIIGNPKGYVNEASGDTYNDDLIVEV